MVDELSLTELNRKVGEHIMGVDYSDAIYHPNTGMYFWKSNKTMLHEHQFTSELNMAWVVLATFYRKYESSDINQKLVFVRCLIDSLDLSWKSESGLVELFDRLNPEELVRAVWQAYEEMESGEEKCQLPLP